MSNPIKFIVNTFVILFIQLFFLNDIMLKSSLSILGFPVFIPIIYPLIILLLPVNTPHWLLLILGFCIGITVDMFSNTPGMHAIALVAICYLRPFILNLFFQQNTKELGDTVPSLFRLGITSFLLYVVIEISIHHFIYYTLQVWSFKGILVILLKTVLSAITSILLIVLAQLLFAKRETKRA